MSTLKDRVAAALAVAEKGTDPLGRVTALALSGQAIRSFPGDPVAWQHRAIVLEQLQLSLSAAASWKRCLSLAGTSSSLGEEARVHLRRLEAGEGPGSCWHQAERWRAGLAAPLPQAGRWIEGDDVQAARLFLEDELLPAWAEAFQRGDRDRSGKLAGAAASLAEEIAARSGETMPSRIVDRTVRTGEQGARAILAYRRGRTALRSLRFEDCVRDLGDAARQLEALDNPESLRARAYRVTCLARMFRRQEAQADLARLAASPVAGVRAHVAELAGAQLRLEEMPAQAVPYFRRAAALFAQSRELASLAIVQGELADGLFGLGELEEAWRTMEETLRTGARSCNAYVNGAGVWTAGDLLFRAGAFEAASAFQQESLARERANGDPALIVESLRTLALNDLQLGRGDEAVLRVREARGLLPAIPSPSLRETQGGFLDWIEGTARAVRDPRAAIPLLSRALGRLETSGRDFEKTAARLSRGHALLDTGRPREGRADLRLGIEAYERLRERVATGADPARAFAQAEPAFDALTAALLTEGKPDAALAISERGRRPFRAASGEGGVACLPEAAGSKTGTLYLDAMDDWLVVWWSARGRMRSWTVPWSRETLRERIRALADARGPRFDRLGAFAREALLPLQSDLAALERIDVIAEDALAVVPWNAMPDARGGVWLDRLVVTTAPSLAVARAGGRPGGAPRALVVADAIPDPAGGARLSPLPGAREEGRRIAALYPGAMLLEREGATRAGVLERWQSADVLHFAVHAVVDNTFPEAARLVLSRRGDNIGNLTLKDVASTRFERHPMVVLSACSTRAGRLLPLAGPMDLVRQFLAAGASGVVATLRPVRDRTAAGLMVAFHREYARGADGAEALARAIRALRRSDPRNPDWAAFQYVGGDGRGAEVSCR